MARLTLQERLEISAIEAERARRGFVARALNSPALRWRYGAPRVDQLLIVPHDLRTPDPSFWYEVCYGQFGMAGSLARLNGHSPFDIIPPSREWSRALHGFGWLRHCAAAAEPEAGKTARQLAVEWAIRNRKGTGEPWHPEVLARRVIAWLSHAGLLLEGADERTYNTIAASLGLQLVRLSSAWREAAAGEPRLLALTALVLADLCVAGRDRRLEADLPLLLDELDKQILPDGGHLSRNPATLIELLLDLLPFRQCFRARGRTQPARLDAAVTEMLSMARFLRMGDGLLARFNGVSVGMPARIATVMAYADTNEPPSIHAKNSGYERLEQGDTILIADCGSPPPVILAGEAQAGCLSFEMSSGAQLILSNGGAPGAAYHDWLAAARATASHNTLELGETSSSRLIGNRRIEEILGGMPIRGPTVSFLDDVGSDNGEVGFEASHDGYLKRFGIIHKRRITISNNGRRIVGTDHLNPPRGVLRLKSDIPFAIHFHLHPGIICSRAEKVGTATIELPGQRWRMACEGARMVIEESAYFADASGPLNRMQIVLRGATFGETEVRWAFTRLA